MKTLKNKLLTTAGILTIGGAGLFGSGCASMYERDPVYRTVVDIMPEALQPAGVRDFKERKRMQEMKGSNNNCIQVRVPAGYETNLCEDTLVYYQGEECTIWDIKPPYIRISKPEKSGSILYDGDNSFMVKINELDIFKE